jgi:hypothetical protein
VLRVDAQSASTTSVATRAAGEGMTEHAIRITPAVFKPLDYLTITLATMPG